MTDNNSTKLKREYTYDSYGNVATEKRYIGNGNWTDYAEISYDYTDGRNVSNKINGVFPSSITVTGLIDADNNDIDDVSTSYLYDWYGNMISETDANGETFTCSYDKLDRLTGITNPDSSQRTYSYNVALGVNEVVETDENGNQKSVSYDNYGRVIKELDLTSNTLIAEHSRKHINYEFVWEDVAYSTQNTKTITRTYANELGQNTEKQVLDNSGNMLYHEVYDYEYAVDGMLSKVTTNIYGDSDSETVKNIKYTDIYGNVVKEETVYNDNGISKTAKTEYTYDYLGNVKTVREPRAFDENWSLNEYTAQYEYDAFGNVTTETDINGDSIINTYDGLGNLVSVTDKNGNTTTNTYDVLGRLLKEQIPFQQNGASTVYAVNKYYYDANGNITKEQTANNAVGAGASYTKTEYEYNWQNQPVKVKGYDGTTVKSCVQYYYDSVGNMLRMYTGNINGLVINGLDSLSGTTSNYAVTKYAYDSMNRCITQTDALGQITSNVYDINGSLIQTTDRNGNVLSYSCDGLTRLLQKSSSRTADDTYTYSYNKKGSRISMTGGGVNTVSEYDNLGRLTKETLTDGAVKEYTYDINGNRKSFKLTKDNAVQYTLTYDYDNMNRLEKVYEDGVLKAEYEYNADGTLSSASYGSRTTDYTYNLASLLTEVNTANGNTQISNYSYTYYLDGNQRTKEESVAGTSTGTTTYTYDGLSRLKKEQAPNRTMSYNYDYYGNRTYLNVTGSGAHTESYVYDKNNRLTKLTKTANSVSDITSYWYDPNGNQISSMSFSTATGTTERAIGIELAGGTTNSISEYNSWNQLISTRQNGKTASYTYNGDGLRMSKTVDGTTTSHIWDGANIAADETNGTVTKYIRGLQLISSKNGNNENFYNYNGHGDVVQLTNSSGSITKQYGYDAFGVEIGGDDTDTNPFRYCGEYQDLSSSLIYLRNRYYDPSIGRFISEDPAKDGLNWYAYCAGNPVMLVDPWGLDSYIIYTYNTVSGDGKHTFADEAEIRKKQLEDAGRTNVHLLGVASAKDFERVWNTRVGYDMDGYDVPIEDVIIIAHGSIEGNKKNETAQSYLFFVDGNGVKTKLYAKYNAGGNTDIAVSDLAWKHMDWLTFSACNTGNPDVYNLAYALKIKMTVNKYIIAWDGGTIFDYNTNELKAGGPNSNQHTWYKYVDKTWYGAPKRERIGYRQIKG